jgi:predicted CXXCH cytochrome family protein
VLADFANTSAVANGDTVRFTRRGERYFAHLTGPDGVVADFEVLYTFGVEPLQQYLVPLEGGRLQALTVAWDTERGEWFDLYPGDTLRPGDPLHWSGRLQRWNGRCAECHSTGLRVSYDVESDIYRTTWASIDVGCQACHGPGATHTAQAQSGTFAESAYGLVAGRAKGRDAGWIDTCARCHVRRSRMTAEHLPGSTFDDEFALALLREDLYHADGQILDEVYVTGSFLQSLMHRRGVVCTDCHDAHSGATVAQGNSLCTRCHGRNPPASFPTLHAADYDSPAHHHHEPDSPGAACIECHMPSRTYMRVDPRRDHGMRIPRPDLSATIGTPNACTGCHTERPAEWAAAAVDTWYGAPERPPHYGEALTAARSGAAGSVERLVAILGDTTAPAIVRATAVDQLGAAGTRDAILAILDALRDPDALVRATAVDALDAVPADSRPALLVPLLSDGSAPVRIAAARMLAPVASRIAEPGVANAIESALSQYRAAQLAQADQPESHHNLGELHSAQGRPRLAEASYVDALRIDSTFLPARVNLAMLYNEFGRDDEAERLLRGAIALEPDLGELHYSLGLLLAELGRLDESAAELAVAADLLPGRPRVHYNLGLALQLTGDLDGAEAALLRAHSLAPADPAFVNSLAHFYRTQSRSAEAARYARMLRDIMNADSAG